MSFVSAEIEFGKDFVLIWNFVPATKFEHFGNFAEIGEDTDDDIDSTPGNDIDRDRRKEDDLDIEELQLPEGKYELDIVKTDTKGNVIKDLVKSINSYLTNKLGWTKQGINLLKIEADSSCWR